MPFITEELHQSAFCFMSQPWTKTVILYLRQQNTKLYFLPRLTAETLLCCQSLLSC